MGLTEQERGRLRHVWGALATAALDPTTEDFRRQAIDAPNWASPLDHDSDAFVLFGFARLAKAYARSRVADQARRRPMLTVAAQEVTHMLAAHAAGLPPPPPPPSLPFRRDIDG